MMRSVLVLVVGAALLLGCVPEASRRPAGGAGSAETGMTAVPDTATPAELLAELAAGNAAGLKAAGLAADRAVVPAVRDLALTLVADHTRNRARLESLAKEMGLPLPASAGRPDSLGADALAGLQGVEFDRTFVRVQIEAHRSGINAIQNHLLAAAQGEQVRRYLEATLTAMRAHLASLAEVQARLPADDRPGA